MKKMFEKACTIAVIVWFFYHLVLLKIGRETVLLIQKLNNNFWAIVKSNDMYLIFGFIILLFIAVILILWVLQNDNKKTEIKEE